jgi:hypothetical protein
MPSKLKTNSFRIEAYLKRFYSLGKLKFLKWLSKSWVNRVFTAIMIAALINFSGMYIVAQWYIWQNRNKPVELGATFIPDYAERLGTDPKETLSAILYDLDVKNLRLVSYWDNIESQRGSYDFSETDWQFEMAEQANAKVSLAVGLRQPRWPECHMPGWAHKEPKSVWYPELKKFMTAVIERYRDSPALASYQLENEFFLTVFGECKDFDRERLIEEAELVRKLDPHHKLIISRSNNGVGLPIGQPRPDVFGVSVYKRVWDRSVTRRYFEYPFPAWFYGGLAGWGKLTTGKDLIIHELQAESWAPDGYDITDAPISELYKSMNPERLKHRFGYAEATGMKHIDLWGVEWWYQMKVKRDAPELWETAKQEYKRVRESNQRL